MSAANLFMYSLGVSCALLALWRVYSRSTVRKLRAHLASVYEQLDEMRGVAFNYVEENSTLTDQLTLALRDLVRCERKLARARTGRARWQALAAEQERLYRNEFKRAAQAETRFARLVCRARYGEAGFTEAVAAEPLRSGELVVRVAP